MGSQTRLWTHNVKVMERPADNCVAEGTVPSMFYAALHMRMRLPSKAALGASRPVQKFVPQRDARRSGRARPSLALRYARFEWLSFERQRQVVGGCATSIRWWKGILERVRPVLRVLLCDSRTGH